MPAKPQQTNSHHNINESSEEEYKSLMNDQELESDNNHQDIDEYSFFYNNH